jgi:hypothetical protein
MRYRGDQCIDRHILERLPSRSAGREGAHHETVWTLPVEQTEEDDQHPVQSDASKQMVIFSSTCAICTILSAHARRSVVAPDKRIRPSRLVNALGVPIGGNPLQRLYSPR